MKKLSAKHIMTLIAMCGLTGACIGICMNTAAVFYTPVAEDLGATRAAIALTMTLSSLAGSLMGLFIPKIVKNPKNLKPMIAVSAFLVVGGTFMLSKCNSLMPLYFWNIVRGLGSGLCNFMLATMVINNWFYANHGVFVSAVMCFSGIPGLVFANLFTNYIELYGWRTSYIIVAAFLLVFFIPALVFPLSMKPDMIGEKPYGYEDYETVKKISPEKMTLKEMHVPNEGLKFGLLMMFTITVCIVAGIMQQFPAFAMSIGSTAAAGAAMFAACNAANITSKILFGILSDRIGTKKTAILYASMSGVALFLMPFFKVVSLLMVLAFAYGFTMANSSAALSLATSDLFGMVSYNRLYPIINFTGSCAFAIGVTLIGLFVDLTGSYSALMWIGAALQACAVLIFMILYAMNSKYRQ